MTIRTHANLSSQGIEVLEHGAVRIPAAVKFKFYYSLCDLDTAETYRLSYMKERWDYFNKHLFGGVMKEPKFVVSKKKKSLGVWYAGTKRMEFGTQMFRLPSETTFLGTMVHEMAHQYDSDVLHTPYHAATKGHGPSWMHIMESIGMISDRYYRGPKLKTVKVLEKEKDIRRVLDTNKRVEPDGGGQNRLSFKKYTVLRYANPEKGADHPIVARPYGGYMHGFIKGWKIKKDGTPEDVVSMFNPEFCIIPGPLKIRTPLYRAAQAIADEYNGDLEKHPDDPT